MFMDQDLPWAAAIIPNKIKKQEGGGLYNINICVLCVYIKAQKERR